MSDEQRNKGRRTIEVGPTGKIVAANLVRLRKSRGLTTRQLSGALERAGRLIPASGITRMEKAERVVTVDDLVALAVAFGVSPSGLLLPLDDSPETTFEITGGGTVTADVAWDWMDGERPLKVTPGTYDEELEHDLYSRPPRRRRSWRAIRGRVTIIDPEAPAAQIARQLMQDDAGGGEGGPGLD